MIHLVSSCELKELQLRHILTIETFYWLFKFAIVGSQRSFRRFHARPHQLDQSVLILHGRHFWCVLLDVICKRLSKQIGFLAPAPAHEHPLRLNNMLQNFFDASRFWCGSKVKLIRGDLLNFLNESVSNLLPIT